MLSLFNVLTIIGIIGGIAFVGVFLAALIMTISRQHKINKVVKKIKEGSKSK